MRYRQYLIRRYRVLAAYSGILLIIIGLLFLIPLLVIPFYPEEIDHIGAFIIASLALVIPGAALRGRSLPHTTVSLSVQEGMVIVIFVWLTAITGGSLPFMIAMDLTFTQAMFEATSGLTTTGLSVVDVTTAPRTILFYRSFIQLIGGAGFVIIALSAIAGPSGAGLSVAEGRGEQLAPHIRASANIVIRIYVGYMIFGVVALLLAGMGVFDAINHAFTAIATGGFSTRPESIGYWDSPTVEAVTIILMMLGALNFLTAFTLFKGKFGAIVRNSELRLATVLLVVSFLSILTITTLSLYPFDKAARVAIFESVSALSGTGFSIVSYGNWDSFGLLVLVALMTIGGGAGSTAGGLKQYRVYVLYKAIWWEFRRAFLPRHIANQPSVWEGERRNFLSDERVRQVALFAFLYLFAFFIGTGITAAHGYSIGESLFEFSSTLATTGLSVGVTQANAPESLLWAQIIGMMLGRLEFFAIIIGLTKLLLDSRMIFFVREETVN